MWAIACSTEPENPWGDSPFLPDLASSTAFCATSMSPFFSNAEMPTTSQLSAFAIFAKSIVSPFLFTTSIMLTAITIGIPSSASCVER